MKCLPDPRHPFHNTFEDCGSSNYQRRIGARILSHILRAYWAYIIDTDIYRERGRAARPPSHIHWEHRPIDCCGQIHLEEV